MEQNDPFHYNFIFKRQELVRNSFMTG